VEKERGLGPRQEMKDLTLFLFSSLQASSLPLLKQRKPRVQELPEDIVNRGNGLETLLL